MRIEIIEVKPRTNIKKIILIIFLATLLVAVFGMLGIYFAKQYNNKDEKQSNQISTEKADIKEEINLKIDNDIKDKDYGEKINNIYDKNTKIAYLTFDDGPSQAVTPLVLDVLKEENVKATFFVLGSNVKKNPEIVKRAYLEGHYIANHGYSHNYDKIYKTSEDVLKEYNKTEQSIQNAIDNKNYSSKLFRFPGGYNGGKYKNIKKEAGKLLNKNNISYIDWNVLTGDAEGANSKEKILENVKKYMKNKGNIVILMHDSSSKILTYETLKDVISYLREEGYVFENFYQIFA